MPAESITESLANKELEERSKGIIKQDVDETRDKGE